MGGIASWSSHMLEYYKVHIKSYEFLHFNVAIKNKSVTNHQIFVRLYYGIKEFLIQYFSLKTCIKRTNPDIIHITSSASLGLFKDYFTLRFARKRGIKSVIHFRFGRITELSEKKNWEWKMLFNVVSLCSECIVLDRNSYNTLVHSGFNHIHVLPNPLAPNVVKLSDEIGTPEREPGVLLFVGRIVSAKGVYDLLDAIKDIDQFRELRFVGPVEEDIKNSMLKISKENYKSIKFVGVLGPGATFLEMKKCAIFVLPSHTEGFPNVLLEAMACSAPIISTDVGAILDILGEENGICVQPKNNVQLAAAIKKLLDDEALALKLGSNAKNSVLSRYSMDTVIGKMEDIWFK